MLTKKKIKEFRAVRMNKRKQSILPHNQILGERCSLISLIGWWSQSYRAVSKTAFLRLILLMKDINPAFHQEAPRIETPQKYQSLRDSRPTRDKWKTGSTALTSLSRGCSRSRKASSSETGLNRLSWQARRLRVKRLNTKSHSPNQLLQLSSTTKKRRRRTTSLCVAQISTTQQHHIFAFN